MVSYKGTLIPLHELTEDGKQELERQISLFEERRRNSPIRKLIEFLFRLMLPS